MSRRSSLPLLALLCAAAPACRGASGADAPAPSATPAGLETVKVVARSLDAHLTLPGELQPYESVALFPRVSGFVDDVLVDRGSTVHKGQVLVRLAAPELTAQRSEAEAKADVDKSTFERLKAAAQTPGAVASHDLELAQATMDADDAKLDALRTMEGYLTVRAPFDGVITERNVHPGALVGPPQGGAGTPMLRLETDTKLRLTVGLPEADVASIPMGEKVSFGVRAWPGVTFQGTIARSAQSLDPHTRTMAVELDVDNTDRRLASGMFADARWPIRRTAPSLMVPTSAVAQTTESTFVDRVRDGVVEQVPVLRGVIDGDQVEVFGTVAAGDVLLKRAIEDLKSGTKVDVRAPDGGGSK